MRSLSWKKAACSVVATIGVSASLMLGTAGSGNASTYCSSGVYSSSFTIPAYGSAYAVFYTNKQVQNVMFNYDINHDGRSRALSVGGVSDFSSYQRIHVFNNDSAPTTYAGWFVETYYC